MFLINYAANFSGNAEEDGLNFTGRYHKITKMINEYNEWEQRKIKHDLHEKITVGADAEDALWQTIIAYEGHLFYTSSGLPFQYTVKRKRNGDYSGELVINRKEESKTLTRSSVMYAFRIVRERIQIEDIVEEDGSRRPVLILPEYKGPKAIGQIFGISYVYSLFWVLGLIRVPEKVAKKMRGEMKTT